MATNSRYTDLNQNHIDGYDQVVGITNRIKSSSEPRSTTRIAIETIIEESKKLDDSLNGLKSYLMKDHVPKQSTDKQVELAARQQRYDLSDQVLGTLKHKFANFELELNAKNSSQKQEAVTEGVVTTKGFSIGG